MQCVIYVSYIYLIKILVLPLQQSINLCNNNNYYYAAHECFKGNIIIIKKKKKNGEGSNKAAC